MLKQQQKDLIDSSMSIPCDKTLYHYFLDPSISEQDKQTRADAYLTTEIQQLQPTNNAFPAHIEDLADWIAQQHQHTCHDFQSYLKQRQAGAPRRYFQNVSAVYAFLLKVAPVKLVDGAWLYRTTAHWQEPQYHDLIITYLEELGLGRVGGNHVCMYQQLLQHLGLHELGLPLEPRYYQQPLIQLALGYASDDYLPEIIGFNLGYEQLPLHLMITNYELAELSIDSQYFNVHITIDNLDSGHAQRAIRAVERYVEEHPQTWSRIQAGFMLNDVGLSSTQLIAEFDLEQQVLQMMQKKSLYRSICAQ